MITDVIFIILLISLAAYDFKERRLPNILVLLFAALGFYVAWDVGDLVANTLAAAVGLSLFYFINAFYRRYRGADGLGMGDVKLIGAVGLWVGFIGLPLVVFAGSVLTVLYAMLLRLSGHAITSKTRLPLGAFLSIATALVYFFYSPL